jgi:hypothetical protein
MTRDAKAVSGEEYCIKVCQALGIDHALVRGVVIEGYADEVLTVTVEIVHASPILDIDLPPGDMMNVEIFETEEVDA